MIETGEAIPVKQPPQTIPIKKREEACRAIKEMEQQKIVAPSKIASPWSSPMVLVRKKGRSTRFCCDYRWLRRYSQRFVSIAPNRCHPTCFDAACSFSTLDLKSGYWQVELDPTAKEKTAFSFENGRWQFTVMPFWGCNIPATFERLMETVLTWLSWETCLVYLDDIIVHTKNVDQLLGWWHGGKI